MRRQDRDQARSVECEQEVTPFYSEEADAVVMNGLAQERLREVPDSSVALVVTSPPYNLGKQYEERLDVEEYLRHQEPVIAQIDRVLKPDGSICWQVGNYIEAGEVLPLDIPYYYTFKRLGYRLRNRIVWHFGHGLHASRRFSGRYETILWFSKGDKYTFNLDDVRIPSKYPGKRHYKGPLKGKPSGNPLGKNPSDFWQQIGLEWDDGVWDVPNVKANHPEKTVHPCQFPVELAERCILALSSQGEWVLDPYSGVGSSLIAAVKNGRRAIGVEREKKYAEIACDRLDAFWRGELNLRKIGTAVHQPKPEDAVAQKPPEWRICEG